MPLFAMLIRTGVFAEGRFLGKVLDEWISDAQEFVHLKLPHLLTICLIAFFLTRIIAASTRRLIQIADRKDTRPGRVSQMRTFAGISRTTLNAIVWTLTALQVLTIMGVNLGPLLASAGVAGIALGLAAQTIVKDILNGIMIILEDQFNVGDTVRLTGMTGTVESMSLRRTELRDNDGTLYIVPNSQITTVANLSRDYSLATVNIALDFSAPPDPAFAPVFLKDPEVLGVDSIAGSQVVYPVTFKTLATKQYAPVREFRRRVRIALEDQGLLPGDPNRIFREFAGKPGSLTQLPEPENAGPAANVPVEKSPVDPTAIPSETHDPFTATS